MDLRRTAEENIGKSPMAIGHGRDRSRAGHSATSLREPGDVASYEAEGAANRVD